MIYETSSRRFKKSLAGYVEADIDRPMPTSAPPSKNAVHSQQLLGSGGFVLYYGGPNAGDGRSPAISCIGSRCDDFLQQDSSAMSMVRLFEMRSNGKSYVHKSLIETELAMTKMMGNKRPPKGITPYIFLFWKGHNVTLDMVQGKMVKDDTRDLVGWCTAKLGIGTFPVRGKDVALKELEVCHFQIDPNEVRKGYGRACMAALETRRLGHTRLVAECHREVVGFYEKCGWQRAKEDMGQCPPELADIFNMLWVTLDLTAQTTNASAFSNAD